eukprot:UN10089
MTRETTRDDSLETKLKALGGVFLIAGGFTLWQFYYSKKFPGVRRVSSRSKLKEHENNSENKNINTQRWLIELQKKVRDQIGIIP